MRRGRGSRKRLGEIKLRNAGRRAQGPGGLAWTSSLNPGGTAVSPGSESEDDDSCSQEEASSEALIGSR